MGEGQERGRLASCSRYGGCRSGVGLPVGRSSERDDIRTAVVALV